jgi:uncharacterized membrane protein required for colicin V production
MTWIDITLIVVLLVFVAVGARLGSLWTGACLIGGFFGAFLVEYYTLPVSEMFGNFTGAHWLAATLLFVGGVVIALVPGWALSRLTAAVFLGFFDSFFGIITGLLAGLVAVSLAFLILLPHAPKIEQSKAWRKSMLAKPLHKTIENFFSDERFHRESTAEQLKDDFVKDFSPALEKTEKSIITTTDNLVKKIKKK